VSSQKLKSAPLQPISGRKRGVSNASSDLVYGSKKIKRTKATSSSVVEEPAPSVDVYDDPEGYTIDVIHSSIRFLATLTHGPIFKKVTI